MLHVKFENHGCSGFREQVIRMDLNARVDVNFARDDVVSNGHCDLILLTFFFILIPINIKVLLILHTKFQPNILTHFGEMDLNARVDISFFRVDVNFQTATVT